MLLYIIRHGDPIYDPDSLTPLGIEQAKALVPRLAPLGFDKIYCSPMIRAQQTAAPTCEALGMTPEIREFLSEDRAFAKMSKLLPVDDEGRDLTRLSRRWCFHRQVTDYKNAETYNMTDNWQDIPVFSGCEDIREAYDFIKNGSNELMAELGYIRKGDRYIINSPKYERVAVFCHQGVGLTWISHLLCLPPHIIWGSFDITHTGISVLEFRNYANGETAPICLCMSDTSHLFAGGLPMKYQGVTPF